MHIKTHAAIAASYQYNTAPFCHACGDDVAPARARLGYKLCLPCGEAAARRVKHCIVPLHKSSYVLITDRDLLVGINNKQPR